MRNDQLNYLSNLLEEQVREHRLFGASITIGNREGELYSSSHGDIRHDTPCMLCSMTKPVTAVAAWILQMTFIWSICSRLWMRRLRFAERSGILFFLLFDGRAQ